MQGNYRTSRVPRYCCPYHRRFASMFHSWNQAFRNTGFLGRSPNINPAWLCEQRRRTTHLTILCISNHETSSFMIITLSFSPFSLGFSNRKLSNSTADVGFVKVSSDCFCRNGLQNEYWCLLPPLLQQFYDFQTQSSSMYGDSFHLVFVFGHSST